MDAQEIDVALPIKLGQFLKYAGAAENGAQTRQWIQHGYVTVNGEVEMRRGHHLSDGDCIEISRNVGITLPPFVVINIAEE